MVVILSLVHSFVCSDEIDEMKLSKGMLMSEASNHRKSWIKFLKAIGFVTL